MEAAHRQQLVYTLRPIIMDRKASWNSVLKSLRTGTSKSRPRRGLLTGPPRSRQRKANKDRIEREYAHALRLWSDRLAVLDSLRRLPQVVQAWKRPARAARACDQPCPHITRTSPFDMFAPLEAGQAVLYLVGEDGSEVWSSCSTGKQIDYCLRILTDPTWTPEDRDVPKSGDSV